MFSITVIGHNSNTVYDRLVMVVTGIYKLK